MLEWFKEAGINMKIEQLTWADWLSQVWVNKDFQISMMNFFTLWEPDFLYYSLWHSTGAFNYRHIRDPELDDLLQKARVTIDRPINIHLTGCHNSCAQHYIGDIGLEATKVEAVGPPPPPTCRRPPCRDCAADRRSHTARPVPGPRIESRGR